MTSPDRRDGDCAPKEKECSNSSSGAYLDHESSAFHGSLTPDVDADDEARNAGDENSFHATHDEVNCQGKHQPLGGTTGSLEPLDEYQGTLFDERKAAPDDRPGNGSFHSLTHSSPESDFNFKSNQQRGRQFEIGDAMFQGFPREPWSTDGFTDPDFSPTNGAAAGGVAPGAAAKYAPTNSWDQVRGGAMSAAATATAYEMRPPGYSPKGRTGGAGRTWELDGTASAQRQHGWRNRIDRMEPRNGVASQFNQASSGALSWYQDDDVDGDNSHLRKLLTLAKLPYCSKTRTFVTSPQIGSATSNAQATNAGSSATTPALRYPVIHNGRLVQLKQASSATARPSWNGDVNDEDNSHLRRLVALAKLPFSSATGTFATTKPQASSDANKAQATMHVSGIQSFRSNVGAINETRRQHPQSERRRLESDRTKSQAPSVSASKFILPERLPSELAVSARNKLVVADENRFVLATSFSCSSELDTMVSCSICEAEVSNTSIAMQRHLLSLTCIQKRFESQISDERVRMAFLQRVIKLYILRKFEHNETSNAWMCRRCKSHIQAKQNKYKFNHLAVCVGVMAITRDFESIIKANDIGNVPIKH